MTRPNAVMAEAGISTAMSRGSLDFSVIHLVIFYFDIVWQTKLAIYQLLVSCWTLAHCVITMSYNINIKQDCLLI